MKKFLTKLDTARDFLQIHLPAEIRDICDLSSLTIESGSYLEDDLKLHCCDVLYKINLHKQKLGKQLYVYTLVEHQSAAESLMPLRILRYQLDIIQKHLDGLPKYSKKKLPLVVPIVFYNGVRTPYPYQYDIANLFEDKELYQQFPLGRFKLIDLTIMEDNEILKHGKIALLETLAKHIRARDFSAAIENIISALKIAYADDIARSLVQSSIYYLLLGREEKELKAFFTRFKQELAEQGEDIMSYGEKLIQQGRQEGIQIGEQRVQQVQREIAQQLLKSGVDSTIIANATHLSPAQIEELKKSLT